MKRQFLNRIKSISVLMVLSLIMVLSLMTPVFSAEEIILDFVHWANNPEESAITIHQVKAFEKNHPGIKVNEIIIPANYDQKLLTMLAGGTPPDVMQINCDSFPMYAPRNVLLPLTELMKADAELYNDFYPLTLETYTYKNEIYGVPRTPSPLALFYNKTMFDEAGIPYPDETWTWEKVLEEGKKLTKDTDGDGRIDQWGIGLEYAWSRWANVVWMYGGDVFSEDFREVTIDSPETKAGLQFYADLALKHKIAPSPQSMTDIGTPELFETGKIGMYMMGIWFAPGWNRITAFDWDTAIVPKGPNGRITRQGPSAFCVGKGTRYPEEAWLLARWMGGKETQIYMSEQRLIVPSLKSVANSAAFLNPKTNLKPKNAHAFLDLMDSVRPLFPVPGLSEVDSILSEEFDNIWTGKISVDEATARVKPRLEKWMQETKPWTYLEN